jgi:RimJ/RimL family protein N-acetyltransferase
MLIGKRIILRALDMKDLEKTHSWRNDISSIKMTLGIRFPKTLEMGKEWFQHTLNDKSNRSIYFAIDELDTNLFIGIIQLNEIDWISGVADFGINIGDKSKTGLGYGIEAIGLLFDYAFDVLNLRKINLRVVAFNKKAIKSYKTIGFLEEGILKEQVYYDGIYHDIVLMALFKKKIKI